MLFPSVHARCDSCFMLLPWLRTPEVVQTECGRKIRYYYVCQNDRCELKDKVRYTDVATIDNFVEVKVL